MVSADQIFAHVCADYLIQSDWMATEKTKRSLAAAIHALTYTVPFAFITRSPVALFLIAATHFLIDRWRLARYVCWLKNFIGSPWSAVEALAFVEWTATRILFGGRMPTEPIPAAVWNQYRRPWSECTATGYPDSRPAWLTVWLLIIADNSLHIGCNALAIRMFG